MLFDRKTKTKTKTRTRTRNRTRTRIKTFLLFILKLFFFLFQICSTTGSLQSTTNECFNWVWQLRNTQNRWPGLYCRNKCLYYCQMERCKDNNRFSSSKYNLPISTNIQGFCFCKPDTENLSMYIRRLNLNWWVVTRKAQPNDSLIPKEEKIIQTKSAMYIA